MTDEVNDTGTKQEKQATMLSQLEAMVGADIAPARPAPAQATITVMDTIPPRDYDVPAIEAFLDRVFHAGIHDDAHILTWAVKPTSSPSFPRSEESLLSTLSESKMPRALYFGTATCRMSDDGKLYNRKALFSSLHVVILDDIGTKVPFDRIPADFTPSYKLETSAGNFQYGYILDEPVDDLGAAEALIQLVYESGCSDEGGKLPNKLVRMPEGVNGKPDKGGFVSRITEMSPKNYSPQEILDALKLDTSWEEVLEDADSVTKRRASQSVGATPWSNLAPVAASLNGIVDPVLEWLYENDLVNMDNGGEFVDIKCPWGSAHSTGDGSAGYAPLGRGTEVDVRGFHCFHDACSGQHTPEFLKHIASVSGIAAGVRDPAALLTTQYVFDAVSNAAWDIKSFDRDRMIPMTGFANLHPHTTTVYDPDGKPRRASMTALWKTSPMRVTVDGALYDPSTTARITTHNGANFVNMFSMPEWGKGPVDMSHVDMFKEYLEYLIPEKDERDYFTHWLSAKVQDVSFRGAAMVMVANQQGVGRSTLADMIKTLLGEPNIGAVPLTTMLGDSPYNEWQEKPFVIVEETLAGERKDFYSNYEKLKTFIDPRTGTVTINPKYGRKRTVKSHTSYLFLTNHTGALALPEEDRRFYVMSNAIAPAEPALFTRINTWLDTLDEDGLPLWGRHVARWLRTLPVDIEALTAPPPKTSIKTEMSQSSMSDIDFAVKVLIDVWPDAYFNAGDAFKVFSTPLLQGPLDFFEGANKKHIKTRVNQNTTAYKGMRIKVDGVVVRPRALNRALLDGTARPLGAADAADLVTAALRGSNVDFDAVASQVYDALELENRV